LKYYNLFIIALLTSNSRTMRRVFCIRYPDPAESGHQLSGDIRYPVKIAIRYIPN